MSGCRGAVGDDSIGERLCGRDRGDVDMDVLVG